jgi:hypothetical protein
MQMAHIGGISHIIVGYMLGLNWPKNACGELF